MIHAEFVRIHPFADGNGRTARLLLNYYLLKNRFLPISVDFGDRSRYYSSLDKYGLERTMESLVDFSDLVAEKELEELEKYIKEIDLEKREKK